MIHSALTVLRDVDVAKLLEEDDGSLPERPVPSIESFFPSRMHVSAQSVVIMPRPFYDRHILHSWIIQLEKMGLLYENIFLFQLRGAALIPSYCDIKVPMHTLFSTCERLHAQIRRANSHIRVMFHLSDEMFLSTGFGFNFELRVWVNMELIYEELRDAAWTNKLLLKYDELTAAAAKQQQQQQIKQYL